MVIMTILIVLAIPAAPQYMSMIWVFAICSHLWLVAKHLPIVGLPFTTFPACFPRKSVWKLAGKLARCWCKSLPSANPADTLCWCCNGHLHVTVYPPQPSLCLPCLLCPSLTQMLPIAHPPDSCSASCASPPHTFPDHPVPLPHPLCSLHTFPN